MTRPQTDRRVQRGDQTRRAILGRAVDIASVEGLEGLSIGRLATELSISKSGVFAHFGSKEELQLATVHTAAKIFITHVVQPALEVAPGVRRVWRLVDAKLRYLRDSVFPGGCFFFAVSAEIDARPGRVRDAVADAERDWARFWEQTIVDARQLGEIGADVDAAQLAFELDAYIRAANANALLLDDLSFYDRALAAARRRLRECLTDPDLLDGEDAPLG